MSSDIQAGSALSILVHRLPEVYQPIYGHPELSEAVSRQCDDRLHYIISVYKALADKLKRPLKVLDLGCAQGYISFHLAEQGAQVHGLDYLDENIDVCHALAKEYLELNISFECGFIEETLDKMKKGDYDLVLGLSVFHHLCHHHGKEAVTDRLCKLADKIPVAVLELALAEEPVEWADSLYQNERELIEGFAFVRELSRHATHLSEHTRPLYFCSSQYWYLDEIVAIEKTFKKSHALAAGVHQGTRSYFIGEGKLAKVFLINQNQEGAANLTEIRQEAEFLCHVPQGFSCKPALHSWEISEREAWLVRDYLQGTLLLDLIQSNQNYDPKLVLQDVLCQLTALEQAGLYHNDVRTWNTLVVPDGHATLVDFGSISSTPADCVWPHDLILAFFIFVRDVVKKSVGPRQPFFNPFNLPQLYKQWILAIWKMPVEQCRFPLFYEEWVKINSSDHSQDTNQLTSQETWNASMEQFLDQIAGEEQWAKDHLDEIRCMQIVLNEKEKQRQELLTQELDALARELKAQRTNAV